MPFVLHSSPDDAGNVFVNLGHVHAIYYVTWTTLDLLRMVPWVCVCVLHV